MNQIYILFDARPLLIMESSWRPLQAMVLSPVVCIPLVAALIQIRSVLNQPPNCRQLAAVGHAPEVQSVQRL